MPHLLAAISWDNKEPGHRLPPLDLDILVVAGNSKELFLLPEQFPKTCLPLELQPIGKLDLKVGNKNAKAAKKVSCLKWFPHSPAQALNYRLM